MELGVFSISLAVKDLGLRGASVRAAGSMTDAKAITG
jgi:hypothetical protein